MSHNKAKRPKVEDGEVDDGGATMADILAKLSRMDEMQNEIDSMKGKLSHMDEMQSEMDDMKKEITKRDDYINSKMLEMDELVSKCKHLEDKCGKLEKKVKLLVKDWEYSAPDIQESYWEDQGFDQQYIDDMRDFLEEIKEETCHLRNEEQTMGINLGHWKYQGHNEDNEHTALLYDDILLPHWKELVNALMLYDNVNDETWSLNISDVQLPPSVIDLLLPALKGKRISRVYMENNEFTNHRKGIEFAVQLIEGNGPMKQFEWTDNQINNMEDAQLLVDAIVSHPLIHHVQLDNCFSAGTRSYSVLQPLLVGAGVQRYDHVELANNNISTGGCTAIPDYITSNPPLRYLNFSNNNLNDEDAILISRALKHNTNLQTIKLKDNDITGIGRNMLLNVIYDNSSLNSVTNSNHSCHIEGFDYYYHISNVYFITLDNRRSKVYNMLSKRNREGSNVHHLNMEWGDDDSLTLVPHVLECTQKTGGFKYQFRYVDDEEVSPLSIMYEILRSWKMPELFEQQIKPTVS